MPGWLRLLAAAFLASAALAQLPSIPHGGGTCSTDDDCSLGGECVNLACQCDIWFTGENCALLNLQPVNDTESGTCGRNFQSYYSWGGKTIYDSGAYHLYASFMCNHNTLNAWTTASASAHFVSGSPTGPFSWAPEDCSAEGICSPVVQPWSHNTVIVQNLPGQSPAYLLWHIGDGVAPPSEWYPCFNTSQVGHSQEHGLEYSQHEHSQILNNAQDAARAKPAAIRAGPGNTAYVQTSDSVSGPWTALNNNSGVAINFNGSWTTQLAGNPAPLILDNGTTLLYFTALSCPPNSGAKAANCIAVAVGDSWAGPFDMRGASHPITYPESEDPFVFRDPRGNFHLLTNVNTCHARCAAGVPCGGHAWSRDGLTFSNLTIGAFGPVITFTNGSVWTNAYVERPLVTQAPDGTPLSFHVGMGRSAYEDSCNWAQLFCTPGAKNCGPTWPAPTPAPIPVKLMNSGQCLMYNASSFPCSGTGGREGCPVVMGPCDVPGAVWLLPHTDGPAAIASNVSYQSQQIALDVDCDSTAPHTLVKALVSGPAMLRFDAASGTVAFEGGMCLNTGQGPPVPPCGPAGEVWLPNQIQLAPCTDPTASGWTAVPITGE